LKIQINLQSGNLFHAPSVVFEFVVTSEFHTQHRHATTDEPDKGEKRPCFGYLCAPKSSLEECESDQSSDHTQTQLPVTLPEHVYGPG
jgi:hypothetical protein